jgi:hypothetical protein
MTFNHLAGGSLAEKPAEQVRATICVSVYKEPVVILLPPGYLFPQQPSGT